MSEAVPVPNRWRRRLLSVGVAGALVLVWEGSKALFAIPNYKLPHVHEILGEFVREGAGGTPWAWIMAHNAGYTALESLAGFALGATAGLGLAVIFAESRLLERGLLPYVMVSQTVPILAVAPMVVVWLGTSWVSKAVIAAYLTFFPVTVNMLRGLRTVNPDALALMRAFAATPRQVFLKLRFPAALPYLFTALRLSATASVVGAIIGELPVGSRFGMGVVYTAENLDVTIIPGGPDIVPEQVVAGGGAEFGIDWLPSLLSAREQGVDPEAFKRTADIALRFGVIKKPAEPAAYTHEVWELSRTLR